MLLGLALIAGPLLVAVVDAAIQIRSLSETSQELVLEGVQSARLSQSLFADITSLERTVRLYQVLGDPRLLDTYRTTDQRLAATRTQLAALLTEEPTRQSLEDFAAMHNEIASAVSVDAAGQPGFRHASSRASTGSTTSPMPSRRAATARSTRGSRNCSSRPRARSGACSGSPRCSSRSR